MNIRIIKINCILILGTLFLLSCNGKRSDKTVEGLTGDTTEVIAGPVHLEFENIINNKREIYLSDFVEDIEYIELETDPAYLIGDKSVQVAIADSFIVINEHGKPVGLFSRSGKFIRTIGKIGKGPGEYDFDTYFRLNREDNIICVWNAMRGVIMEFDLEGRFINEIKPECKPGGFGYVGNNVFVTSQNNIRYADSIVPRFVVFDQTGATINRTYVYAKNPLRTGRGITIMLPSFYEAPDGVIINTYENDTIFKVFPDGELNPAITWNTGHFKVPYDPLLNYAKYSNEKEKYITNIEGLESESYWMISYQFQGNYNMALLNRSDGSVAVVSNPDEELKGVINDIDGGPSFWPSYYVTAGKFFFCFLYPTQLKKWSDEGKFSRENVLFPDDHTRFIEMVENIDLDDNPILMIVKIK